MDAVKEVIASQIYRRLVGDDKAPEGHLITQEGNDNWIIASKWQDGLSDGIAQMFVAAFIIGDKDCIPKNMAQVDGHIFRYDFGASFINGMEPNPLIQNKWYFIDQSSLFLT